MKQNVGSTDSVLRAILAMAIWFAGFFLHIWWAMFGLVFLITAIVGYCPLYGLLGISTAPKEAK